MKHLPVLLLILILAVGCATPPQNKNTLKELRRIDLPGVNGRIDHMSIDIKSARLFVAALGNGSVEVIDLNTGKDIHSIKGLKEPQGVLYCAEHNLLFVTSAGDGACRIYNPDSYKLLNVIKLGSDADNIRYDKKRDIVFAGFGSGAIAAIDPAEMKLVYKIDLPAHPESFQVDESKGLMYVNVPDAGQMDIINIGKRKVVQKIKLDVKGNFPMALDAINHLIFIGSRNPAKIITFDESSLEKISENNLSGDADDIFYDGRDSLLFISCGSGELDIFKQVSSKKIIPVESIKTSPGARTSLFVPSLHKLFVAARRYGSQNAGIIVYRVNH